jgi:hypothetical protein
MAVQRVELHGELVRRPEVVVVAERYIVGTGQLDAGIAGPRGPPRQLVPHHPDAVITEPVEIGLGAVAGSLVDDDDLHVHADLPEHRRERAGQEVTAVVGRYHHRDARPARHPFFLRTVRVSH